MSTDNVVSTTDVAPLKEPKSFNDLNKEQLVAAALAFGADESGTKDSIKADLTEMGVTWQMYLDAFYPDKDKEPVAEESVLPEPTDIEDWPDADEGVNEVSEIVTKEETPQLAPQDKYLIKMTRANPYFEFEDKKFTQDKPYAIMSAAQAQRILETEDGFRQAYPAELQEFYG